MCGKAQIKTGESIERKEKGKVKVIKCKCYICYCNCTASTEDMIAHTSLDWNYRLHVISCHDDDDDDVTCKTHLFMSKVVTHFLSSPKRAILLKLTNHFSLSNRKIKQKNLCNNNKYKIVNKAVSLSFRGLRLPINFLLNCLPKLFKPTWS